tara:strand:- start:6808 stop:7383 length:576 start_codon:yes stop_codon:yes gene_type:complete
MIGRIKGTLEYIKAPEVLIDVNGIGYEIQMPMTSIYQLPEIGESVIVYTHLIVREDLHLLCGFINENEKAMFKELIKTNGVGAKMALTILSTMSASDFLNAVNNSDINSLTKIPKIGKKTAERLLIEIRDRFKNITIESNNHMPSNFKEDAVNGLVALGYSNKEAKNMIDNVQNEDLSTEELIKEALKNVF